MIRNYKRHFNSGDKPIYTQKQYAKMIEALENKGFQSLGSCMWRYRSKNKEKFITVRIDFAGYVVVNFNNKLTRAMTPAEVIEGTNYLKGKEDHPVIYLPP